MARRTSLVLSALWALAQTGVSLASTYTVTSVDNSGTGSLRWALARANTHVGPDTVTFAVAVSGSTITPSTPLPQLTDGGTTINGDLNDDGRPEVAISGSGLDVRADSCTIVGLAIVEYLGNGIYCEGVSQCVIRSCHLGVDLAGTAAADRPGATDIYLNRCTDCTVGGTAPGQRNIIRGGGSNKTTPACGIAIVDGSGNTVCGNSVGLTRSGLVKLPDKEALAGGWLGIKLTAVASECTDNTIGGTVEGARNLLSGLLCGVVVAGASGNRVQGNYIGLGVDGTTAVPVSITCVALGGGAAGNTIGGTAPGARNVLVGTPNLGSCGVRFDGLGTTANVVQGNYMGMDADGTAQQALSSGVLVETDAGAQTIGGDAPGAGNYIAVRNHQGWGTVGVGLNYGGGGSVVQGNDIGVLPNGRLATQAESGIWTRHVASAARIRDNRIVKALVGLRVQDSSADPLVLRNVFRRCSTAVQLSGDGRCRLGNLTNASPADDGGNIFGLTNQWAIRNETPNYIRAEGNDFGTTSKAAIEARITDKQDNPAYGRVDFAPLRGGVRPSGGTGGAASLAVTGVAAVATAAGVEVAFTLSAPADVTVTVLNVAGRPVATVMQDRAMEAGLQRIAWTGRTVSGTMAPRGQYLIRVTTRRPDGAQTQAVTTAVLR